MSPIKDLTGQVFGRLTVIYRAENYVSPAGKQLTRWHCRCECGNEVDVNASMLRAGRTTSCGCYQREQISVASKSKLEDLTGCVYGRLTVLCRAEDYISNSGHHMPKWRCRCECGNEVDVLGSHLKNGNTTSCGCYRREKLYKKDLTGQVFGRLTVLYRAENYISPTGKHHPRWHCRCECGNEVDVLGSHLKNGKTTSCGCYHRERASASGKKYCIDLTGQVFGRLTVLYRAENYISPTGQHHPRWHCRCECGNEVDVNASSLRAGKTTSCGCYRREQSSVAAKSKLEDLTGCVFGRLTVLYRAEDYISSSGNRIPKWHCRCECGKEVDVFASRLKNRGTQSCGCYQRERASAAAKRKLADLTGCVFGRLTVLYRAEDYIDSAGYHIAKWHCRCECGNEVDVFHGNLTSGKSKSCGCTRASKKRQA